MAHYPQPKSRNLTSILSEAGLVGDDQVEEALFRQRATGHRIGETLVEMGVVSEEDIGWALARQFSLTFVDVRPEALDADLVRSLPESLLRRLQAVPLVRTDTGLSLAMADPTDNDALAELSRGAGCALSVSIATPSRVRDALDAIFGTRPQTRPSEHVETTSRSSLHYDVVWDRSGATFLDFHLAMARRLGGSEILFVPEGDELRVGYRIGSDLVTQSVEPLEVLDFLRARLEALGGPLLAESAPYARGRVSCTIAGDEGSLDVALARSVAGTVVTLFSARRGTPALGELGLSAGDDDRLRMAAAQPAGLILIAGPPRSGGSTTLSALLASLDATRRRIAIFETREIAPIPSATRIHCDPDAPRLDWGGVAVSLSADVLALDGITDGDAIEECLCREAAGRLVIARTDWTDTFALLSRLIVHPRLRALTHRRLLAVVQQRLVRVPPPADESRAHFAPGQRVLFETLFVGDHLRRALGDGTDLVGLKRIASQNGYRSLAETAQRLVAEGSLTPAEANRALS